MAPTGSRSYNNPEVYEWLLKHKRRGGKNECVVPAGKLLPAIGPGRGQSDPRS